jgi:transglutaminase-like putative cysteine protease
MGLIETVRRANRPGVPEDSVRTRVACAGAVLVAILTGAAQGEVSRPVAWAAMAMVVFAMWFAYRTRQDPPGWVKVLVALAAVAAMVWFFHQVSRRTITDITTVENPLTVLFVWIQVVHSFHVPTRRDLLFSLGASAGLMAVAAAQAIDLRYGWYAAAWVGLGMWALVEMWASASGGGRVSVRALASAVVGVTTASALVFLMLPAPNVSVRINFQSRAGSGGPISVPGALAGDSGGAAQLSHPGAASGPTRVGGYLGFANTLDTALRGRLGNTVVMRVRAQRPSYWVAETFDSWDGQSWNATARTAHTLDQGSPFYLPSTETTDAVGAADLQTFYLTSASPDLVFHADSASEVWFPAPSLYLQSDGTIVSPIGLGPGAIYTVESNISAASPGQLQHVAGGGTLLGGALERQYTQLPQAYPRVQTLARTVTADAATEYAKVQALISWIGANTKYSTDIPPLSPGQDTVDEFLFGNRTGFCEQISTSLAVMLRTLGIPARETVGYVPGPYNPITDLYDIQAKDAHAWVEVWFPGYGWQSFDPTAVVPLTNPSPGGTALHDVGRALGQVPWIPVSVPVVMAVGLAAVIRWRRARPPTWEAGVARRMETAGRRAGRPRRTAETIAEYGRRLDDIDPGRSGMWSDLAAHVERSAYGGYVPTEEEKARTLTRAGTRIHRDRVPSRLGRLAH